MDGPSAVFYVQIISGIKLILLFNLHVELFLLCMNMISVMNMVML